MPCFNAAENRFEQIAVVSETSGERIKPSCFFHRDVDCRDRRLRLNSTKADERRRYADSFVALASSSCELAAVSWSAGEQH